MSGAGEPGAGSVRVAGLGGDVEGPFVDGGVEGGKRRHVHAWHVREGRGLADEEFGAGGGTGEK